MVKGITQKKGCVLTFKTKAQCCICLDTFKGKVCTTAHSASLLSSKQNPGIVSQKTTASSSTSTKEKEVSTLDEFVLFATDGCHDYACKPCLYQYFQQYLNRRVEDYSVLDCPEPGCDQVFQAIEMVAQVMPNLEAQHYWWRSVIEKTVMDSIGFCPYSDCMASFELPLVPTNTSIEQFEKNEPIFSECYDCHRGICLQCQGHWHSDKQCKSVAESSSNNSKQPAWRYPDGYREAVHKKRREQRKRELSVEARNLAKKLDWTRCPNCLEMVEKTRGCLFVICKCRTEFCYRCGSKSQGHNCQKQCHLLSPAQINSMRQPMFDYQK